MGAPIAARLARAGHSVKVHDLRRHRLPGAAWADSAAAAVEDAEVAFTSLPGPAEVEALAAQIGPALARGAAWFDLTTNSPACVRRVHASLAARGVQFLDAPVSGGREGAHSGKLALWVGGDEATYRKHEGRAARDRRPADLRGRRSARARSPSSRTTARASPCRPRSPRSSRSA